jgi:tripartite-type tricarboxylate transporter receptor subunit TctC
MRLLHPIACLLPVVATLVCVPAAFAQQYPDKPVRMIVPFPAGGSNDIIARLLAQKLGEYLGQQFIIDNRGGAGGAIGAQLVANAVPDGYTLLMNNPGPAIHNVLLRRKPLYVIGDFAPIMHIGSASSIVVATMRLPAANMKDLVAYAKANPGKLNYGSGGNGSGGHLAGEMFKARAGIFAVHIPYNGGNPAQLALLGGQVDFNFDNLATAAPNIRSGKLKALAVTTLKGVSALPGIAPVADTLKGFAIDTWWGLVAPAATPKEVVARLNQAFVAALNAPETKARFATLLAEPAPSTPEEFAAFMKTERAKYEALVKASGARVD